jgi:hypothetical protein
VYGQGRSFVDQKTDLPKILIEHPRTLVFIDQLDKSDFNFQRSLRNTFEQADVFGDRLKGMTQFAPLRESVFVLATEEFAKEVSEREATGEFTRMWHEKTGDSTVVDIASIVLVGRQILVAVTAIAV